MAYAAVISLKQTIYHLRNSSHISILQSIPRIIDFAGDELNHLQMVLQSLDRISSRSERIDALDGRIREAVFELEDVVENHVSNQFLTHQSEEKSLGKEDDDGTAPFPISVDLTKLKRHFDSFTQIVKKMKEDYMEELTKVEDVAAVPLRPEFEGNESKMVGLTHFSRKIKDELTIGYSNTAFLSLFGMAGIGKTAIARDIFEDPEIVNYFKCRAWVRIGPKYRRIEILRSILAQVNPESDRLLTGNGDEHRFPKYLWDSMKGSKYLLVLDDAWSSNVCHDLANFIPEFRNGSRILVTSRIQDEVDRYQYKASSHKVPFLTKEESWDLLREKVFGERESCPPELEKAGKKIAEKCDGLPLTIVTVAKTLSMADKTQEYWNKVATEKESPVFLDAYEEMTKVLLPSYNYLPQNLKACFLYIGILPRKTEISLSKLINLWSSERFIETSQWKSFEDIAGKCLEGLDFRNVIIVCKKTFISPNISSTYSTEKYRLHSAFLHLCVKEARRTKFYHVLSRYTEDSLQSIKSQRRFCIQNNVLFGIKDLYGSMASVSTARSLLCTGMYHQYPVPICFGLRLLRVLDALTIRFYEFPIEAVELIHLKYLSLTYDGKLPASISTLVDLQCLIVNQHSSIESSSGPSYLPMEIWNMQELTHLQIMGSDLPEPCEGSLLPKLSTLLDVSAHSCTKRVLESIPNLHKLRIRIVLEEDATEPLGCFNHISLLHKLEKLKCVVVNPVFTSEVAAWLPPLPDFPQYLTSLTLSGFGYPWEEMSKIGSLLNLRVLKLRCYAFRGPKWETCARGFQGLSYLLIEDSDLVVWTFGDSSIKWVNQLCFKHCYKLEEIQGELSGYSNRKVKVIDSNPLVVSWAKRMQSTTVDVQCSWEDQKRKS